jgi:hypothetical protein
MQSRKSLSILAALALSGAGAAPCLPALAQEIASRDLAEICSPGYARSHRLVYRHGRPGYEHDHIMPLCLGGSDTEANLQWQPLDEAKLKDVLEWYSCRQVCAGKLSLDEARGWFTSGIWRSHLGLVP